MKGLKIWKITDEPSVDIVFSKNKFLQAHVHTEFSHLDLLSKEGLKWEKSLFLNQHWCNRKIYFFYCLPCYSVDLC